MFLTEIELRNFRCFQEATITGLGPLNFFGGRNGSGKSTIVDAISFALTGTCRGSETGRDLDRVRWDKDGVKSKGRAMVGLHTNVGTARIFERNEIQGPKSTFQEEMDATLGHPGATVRALLYAGEILRLERKQAQALLQALLPTKEITLPFETRKAVMTLLDVDMKDVDLARIDRLYKLAYDRRLATGQEMKGVGALVPPDRPDWLPADSNPREARQIVADRLATIRTERDGKLMAWQQAVTAADKAARQIATYRSELKQVETDLAATMSPAKIKAESERLLTELTEREEINAANEEALARLRKEVAQAEGAMAFGKKRLVTLREIGGKCPTCDKKLTPVEKRDLDAELVKSIESADRDRQKSQMELDVIAPPKSLGEITKELSKIEAEDAKYGRLLSRRKELETLVGENAAKPADVPPVPETKELDKRVAVGEDRLSVLDTYIAQVVEHEKRAEAIASLEADRAGLETLVETFGPEGIRTQLAGDDDLEEFQRAIRVSMATMGFSLDLGPLLRMEDDPHVNGRPARFISESEITRFSMAFACSVAQWSKIGLVCIDAWDRLDEEATIAAGSVLANYSDLQRFVFVTPKKGLEAYRASASRNNGPGSLTRFYVIDKTPKGSLVTLPMAESEIAE